MDERDELARRLDEVVGTRYHEARNASEMIRVGLAKWILGVVFAIGAVCLIVVVIERHRLPPAAAPQPAKPVVVKILPAKEAP
jgi:hypothetical protein